MQTATTSFVNDTMAVNTRAVKAGSVYLLLISCCIIKEAKSKSSFCKYKRSSDNKTFMNIIFLLFSTNERVIF